MSWSLLIVMGCVLGLSVAALAEPAASQPAAPAEPAPVPVYKAAAAPEIDGKLDEPCWRNAVAVTVPYVHGDNKGRSYDPAPMRVKLTWDDRYLYIGYEIDLETPNPEGNGKLQGPDGNQREGCRLIGTTGPTDMVEFFLNTGDTRFFWEIHHNAKNQFNDVFIIRPDPSWPIAQLSMTRFGLIFNHEEYVKDEGPYTLAIATAKAANGKGYTAEIRLPWLGIGAPVSRQTTITIPATQPDKGPTYEPGPWKMAGFEFRVLSVLQSSVLKDRYLRSGPYTGKAWMHEDADKWPAYKLLAATEPAGEKK